MTLAKLPTQHTHVQHVNVSIFSFKRYFWKVACYFFLIKNEYAKDLIEMKINQVVKCLEAKNPE